LKDSEIEEKTRWEMPFKMYSCRGDEACVFHDWEFWRRAANFKKIAQGD